MKLKEFSAAGPIALVSLLMIFLAGLSGSCNVDKGRDTDKIMDTLDSLGFVPREGSSYHYMLKSSQGQEFPFYKRISGTKDSLGLKLYDVSTYMDFFGQQLIIKQKTFNKDNYTTHAFYQIAEWNRYAEQLKKGLEQSGGALLEMKVTRVPFYVPMENDAGVGSLLTFTGGPQQKLYIKARTGSGENSVITETSQSITRHDGAAVKAEKLVVPAGTFECVKWQHAVDNKITTHVNGQLLSIQQTNDFITTWTSHGIGEVKVVAVNSKSGTSTTELVRISS